MVTPPNEEIKTHVHAAEPALRRRGARAGRSRRAWVVFLTVMLLGLGLDLWSKAWAFANVAAAPVVLDRETILADPGWHPPLHKEVRVIPGVLNFRLVLNRGAVFGIGPGQRWFFVVFTLAAISAGVWVFAFRTRARQHLLHVGIACVLAGAGGNLYDRLNYAAVRDFLHLFPDVPLPFGWRWPGGSPELFPWVFNVADVLLLVGIGLLILRMGGEEGDRAEE